MKPGLRLQAWHCRAIAAAREHAVCQPSHYGAPQSATRKSGATAIAIQLQAVGPMRADDEFYSLLGAVLQSQHRFKEALEAPRIRRTRQGSGRQAAGRGLTLSNIGYLYTDYATIRGWRRLNGACPCSEVRTRRDNIDGGGSRMVRTRPGDGGEAPKHAAPAALRERSRQADGADLRIRGCHLALAEAARRWAKSNTACRCGGHAQGAGETVRRRIGSSAKPAATAPPSPHPRRPGDSRTRPARSVGRVEANKMQPTSSPSTAPRWLRTRRARHRADARRVAGQPAVLR